MPVFEAVWTVVSRDFKVSESVSSVRDCATASLSFWGILMRGLWTGTVLSLEVRIMDWDWSMYSSLDSEDCG